MLMVRRSLCVGKCAEVTGPEISWALPFPGSSSRGAMEPDPPAVDAVDSARVAFQGEPGAYSQRAVLALFGDAAPVPMHSLRRVFEAVEIGAVEFGVVPLENSHAGSINESYDLLVRHGLTIVAETIVRISHCLMAPKTTAIEDVQIVYSHSQALDQCEEFLDPLGVKCVAVHDTAGAA